ncbi:MAG: type II toxin-antitoxin system death-on-curing family toxin [Rhodospirillales bacterium]|nr:type II toxin-antitoxin system death-on-curing family toxin [Rhodospirillales bacterium]
MIANQSAEPPIEPRWLTVEMVLAIHDEQLALLGGPEGVRDLGLLESGLARPVNRHHYNPETTIFELAAAYGFGIVKNHPFIDGNKRTGLLALHGFLFLNGWRFDPDQVEEVQMILGLAAGDIEEDELARWVEGNSREA